jgi:hypothetical protein
LFYIEAKFKINLLFKVNCEQRNHPGLRKYLGNIKIDYGSGHPALPVPVRTVHLRQNECRAVRRALKKKAGK